MKPSSTAKLFNVLWSFLPFFALMFVAFVAVFLLHRSYKRRLEIAANREAKQHHRQQIHRAHVNVDSNDNDDGDDDDGDDDGRSAKQHQHRAEKKRMKELKRAYREQLQEQRDRALDEADYNDDPRAVFRAAELRAAQATQFAQEKEIGRSQAAARSAAESASLLRKEQIDRQILRAADAIRRYRSITIDDLAALLDVPFAPLRAHLLTLDDDGADGLFLLDGDRISHIDGAQVASLRSWVHQRGRFDADELSHQLNNIG